MDNQYINKVFNSYVIFFKEEEGNFDLLAEQLKESTSIAVRSNMEGHVTASGLVLHGNNVLLIFHNKLQKYLQPGGHLETDPTLWQSAQREVIEETGLKNVELHPWHAQNQFIPLNIDTHAIPANEKKQEGGHYHHDFMYVFTVNDTAITLQEEEVAGFKWVPLPHDFTERTLKNALVKVYNLGIF